MLTKIDTVDPRLKLRPDKCYQSAVIDELVDRVADKSGFAEKNIHRCKLCMPVFVVPFHFLLMKLFASDADHNESDRNNFVEMMALSVLADVARQVSPKLRCSLQFLTTDF